MPLGPAMKNDLLDVEDYVRFRDGWPQRIVEANHEMSREEISFADPSFFTFFSFKLVAGNPATALKDLHSVVLTTDVAKRLFGHTDPLGQNITIRMDDG